MRRPAVHLQVYRFEDEPASLAELSAVCPLPGALSIDDLVGEPPRPPGVR